MPRTICDKLRRRRVRFDPNIELEGVTQANTPKLFCPPRSKSHSKRTSAQMHATYNHWNSGPVHHHHYHGKPYVSMPEQPPSPPPPSWQQLAPCIARRDEWHQPIACPDPRWGSGWITNAYYHTEPVLHPPTRTAVPTWQPPPPLVNVTAPSQDVYRDVYHYGMIAGSKMTAEQVNDTWMQDIKSRYTRNLWNAIQIPGAW